MKFFTNKRIWSKIIIVLIFVLLFEFVVAKPTLAGDEVAAGVEFGGKLMSPILSLVVTLGDGIIAVLHSSIMGVTEPLLVADMEMSIWEILGHVAVTILAGVVAIALFATGIGGLLSSLMVGIAVGYFANTAVKEAGKEEVQGAVTSYSKKSIPETIYLPAYSLSPEEIFKGNILLFNVDFFGKQPEIKEHKEPVYDDDGNKTGEKVSYYYYINDEGEEVKTSQQNMGEQLSSIISQWYVSIRNIALVTMMIVLLYIGIRMLLSTLASDKAKYKQMLQDWFMGLLLLFLMHYIMNFSVVMVQQLTKIVSASVDNKSYYAIIPMSEKKEKADSFKDSIDEFGLEEFYIDDNGDQTDRDNATAIIYPTNLMGALRIDLQLTSYGAEYIGKAMCFFALVLMTLFFVFTYLRRVLYMAFLTLIAPVVAVTYPIDKINDGSAQGFSKWFREYIFNLLIQPMHLLLYYILITSAFDLAGANVIYSIVAIGFMMPAEKLLRSLFGFEKASTPGTFNGVAGATLAMAGINKIANIGRHGNAGNSLGEAKEKEIDSSNNKPRMNGNVDKEATMIRMSGESETSQNQINDSNNDTTDNASEEGIESGKQENATIGQIPGKIREVDRQAVKVVDNKKAKLANKGKRFVENHVPENIQGLGRGVARVAGAEKAMLANKGKRFIKNYVKPFPKTAFKVSAGVAAASMGVAAGVVTGDPSNALQYGAAGAAAGYVGAGGLIKDGNKEDREVLKEAYYGPKYEAEEQQKYIKDYIKENKAQLNRNFNRQKVKEMSKNGGVIEQSLRNGVDDIKDIMTIQNMMDSGMVKDVNSGITVAQYHRELDNANALSGPNRDKWEESYSKRLQKKNQKMDKREADKIASRSTDIAERFNKMRKNLHR